MNTLVYSHTPFARKPVAGRAERPNPLRADAPWRVVVATLTLGGMTAAIAVTLAARLVIYASTHPSQHWVSQILG